MWESTKIIKIKITFVNMNSNRTLVSQLSFKFKKDIGEPIP